MTGSNDVTDILSAFKPGRATRRKLAGARCGMCGLGITAVDLALVEVEVGGSFKTTRPIHMACTSLLWEVIDNMREEGEFEEDPGVADSPEDEGR